MKSSFGISDFLEEIPVFPILLFSSISLHRLLKKAFLSLAILWNSAFRCLYLSFSPLLFASLLFTAICKASPDSHFAFFAFLFHGDGLDPCLLYWQVDSLPLSHQRSHAKWLSEEALQIAEKRREVKSKGEKERHTHLNAEFQRIARRDKKAFLSDQMQSSRGK